MSTPKWVGNQGYAGRYSGYVECKSCHKRIIINLFAGAYYFDESNRTVPIVKNNSEVLPDKCPCCGYDGEEEKI